MSILVCGSLAFDSIMVFQGRFKEQILPDQIHILSVSFLVPDLRREFGGTAGNIAYNLCLLGEKPMVMATVGDDGHTYTHRLHELGLSTAHVRHVAGTYTAQAFITTDLDDNQITAFHPGAMGRAHVNHVLHAEGATLGIVAPDGYDGMRQHAQEFHHKRIPFVFDPGQGLPMFSGEELAEFMELADYACFNDYEAHVMEERTGKSIADWSKSMRGVVVTLGGKGSTVFINGDSQHVPALKAAQVLDPTGCGDAFRAGLLHGIARGWSLADCAKLGSVMGVIKIEHKGPQNHTPSRDDITRRLRNGYQLDL